MDWGGRGPVLRREVATYGVRPYIHCTEENFHASLLALIVRIRSKLTDAARVTHKLEYIPFLRPCDILHSLNNFIYRWKKIQFE